MAKYFILTSDNLKSNNKTMLPYNVNERLNVNP